MIEVVTKLGNNNNPPKIFVLVPPPLMEHGSIGANQTVINNVYSKLIPLIQQANKNAPLVLVNGPNSEGFHLHGGPVTAEGAFNPELQYREHNGDIWTSLMGVSIALMDSEPDEGGFCVLPGSHKGNFPLPNDFRHGDSDAFHEHIHKPVTKAGDVIFFSEATVHGALPWIPHDAEKERRLALYRFAPPTLSYGRAYLEEWGGNVLENCTEDEKAVLTEPYACRMDRKVPGEVLVERDATKRAHDKKIFGSIHPLSNNGKQQPRTARKIRRFGFKEKGIDEQWRER